MPVPRGSRRETDIAPYYQVLLARMTEPAASIARLTADLGVRLKRELSESAVRQILRRARDKFAKLLIDEISRSRWEGRIRNDCVRSWPISTFSSTASRRSTIGADA